MGANHVGGITHQIGPTRSSCSRSQAAGLGNCNMYSTVWPVQPTSIGTAPMHSMEPSKERLGRECFIIFQCNTKNSSYLLSGSFFLLCTYIIFWVHTHIYIHMYILWVADDLKLEPTILSACQSKAQHQNFWISLSHQKICLQDVKACKSKIWTKSLRKPKYIKPKIDFWPQCRAQSVNVWIETPVGTTIR